MFYVCSVKKKNMTKDNIRQYWKQKCNPVGWIGNRFGFCHNIYLLYFIVNFLIH